MVRIKARLESNYIRIFKGQSTYIKNY
jgi:hypothetical protein